MPNTSFASQPPDELGLIVVCALALLVLVGVLLCWPGARR